MASISQSPHKQIIYWLLVGCFLIYVMVVVGCLTRLTHSGLSITDWSFMGSIPPLNENMWLERFAKYQQSPEFQKVNFEMTLEEFKPIFLWEYIHRMIGRTMMYVFAFGFIYFLLKKKIKKSMWPGFVLLFFMGAMQAVIGWWMVYSGLQKQPAVSHYRLAAHLMSAFILFAFTFWFALRLIYPKEEAEETDGKKIKSLTFLFFIVLIIQIIYGAFTAGYAEGDNTKIRPGHIFNTWPKMGNDWIPEQVYMKEGVLENILENPSGIQFMHRTIALLIVVLICMLWYKSNKLSLNKQQTLGINLLIFGVTIQFILGVLTLLYNVPVIMGTLHQTGAFFLFSISIYLIYHLSNKKPSI
ncbi:COX15/CtaA family protein [Aurantibacillus circumpalustris]|uniref:COX15/CtaA family protein n=1 Tax=Aurantibacillus circumpalustris TaxID=3036359 RepID=UPI00295AB367|nr:COX15/CtaA family protein [Aurantibacillus circumpalustris]